MQPIPVWHYPFGPSTFSPLFIGVISATDILLMMLLEGEAFSPLFIGVISATDDGEPQRQTVVGPFSPLFIGVISATAASRC